MLKTKIYFKKSAQIGQRSPEPRGLLKIKIMGKNLLLVSMSLFVYKQNDGLKIP